MLKLHGRIVTINPTPIIFLPINLKSAFCNQKNRVSVTVLLSTAPTTYERQHEISNDVVCATSNGSDQPAATRSLIRDFASRLNIL